MSTLRIKLVLALGLLLGGLSVPAFAQAPAPTYTTPDGREIPTRVILCPNGTTIGSCANAGAAHAASMALVSCGTTSSTAFTGGSAANGFVRFKVQEGGANSVYFNWTGATATTSNELLAVGESVIWGALSNSVTCITASGTASVVVTW